MPDFTSEGFPLYDEDTSADQLHTLLNGHANALNAFVIAERAALHAADSVATVALLPVTGNWTGRIIFCEEDALLRLWDGAGWVAFGGKVPYYYGERTAANLPSTGGGDQAWVTATQLTRGMTMSGGVITVVVPGIYTITQLVDWITVNTTGQRNLGVATTGTNLGPSRTSYQPPTISTMSQMFTCDVLVNAGDTITPFVAHNSGSTLSIKGEVAIKWTQSI